MDLRRTLRGPIVWIVVAFAVIAIGITWITSAAGFRVISTQARLLNTATSDSFSASRETSGAMVGAVTIDENVFRRDAIDLGMIELLSGAAARMWIDGQVLLRGRGAGMLRVGGEDLLGNRGRQRLTAEAGVTGPHAAEQ